MWLALPILWLGGMALCLAAVIGGIWQYPPLALPLLYLGWRVYRRLCAHCRHHRTTQQLHPIPTSVPLVHS